MDSLSNYHKVLSERDSAIKENQHFPDNISKVHSWRQLREATPSVSKLAEISAQALTTVYAW